ncbi:MAG: M48 family metalloprotease, partial [Rhodospirillaceae bacterium]|nr:M48 family metalloprotease [Rhodospirillaceae bacterium]
MPQILIFLFIFIFTYKVASAQNIEYIRDAEIENAIRMYSYSLFQQAGVEPNAVKIHLVKDNSINAFVTEGLNIFINTGLIIKAEHAGQLIGVIAHECGHISGGHIIKSYDAIKDAKNISLVSTAIVSTILVSAALLDKDKNVYNPNINQKIDKPNILFSIGDDMANKSFMAFSRAIESSADLNALKFLDNIKISSRGLLEIAKIMNEQELFASKRQDPYTKTHPTTSTRINDILHHVETSPWSDVPLPQIYNEVHQRIKAKLIAFIESDATTF